MAYILQLGLQRFFFLVYHTLTLGPRPTRRKLGISKLNLRISVPRTGKVEIHAPGILLHEGWHVVGAIWSQIY